MLKKWPTFCRESCHFKANVKLLLGNCVGFEVPLIVPLRPQLLSFVAPFVCLEVRLVAADSSVSLRYFLMMWKQITSAGSRKKEWHKNAAHPDTSIKYHGGDAHSVLVSSAFWFLSPCRMLEAAAERTRRALTSLCPRRTKEEMFLICPFSFCSLEVHIVQLRETAAALQL